MSDLVSASVEMALAALKTGAAVTDWWTKKESTRSRSSSSAGESSADFYRQTPEDLLYVMATIGQWMLSLEAVNIAAFPAARVATSQAFEAGDPGSNKIGHVFNHMTELVQNAVASGMAFCADCWPMHIWKGFGCGVFNELRWADPNHSNDFCLGLDNSISVLKSQPHPWQLLKKSPSAISKTNPLTEPHEKLQFKKNLALARDLVQAFEKQGFPQPLSPHNHIKISYWWLPSAVWNGNTMYNNELHAPEAIAKHQADPGRFLWAWTAGKHARVSLGEAVVLVEEHIGHLAQWLEGLKGVPFRVLLDSQLDYSKIKFGRSTRALFQKAYGNEHGIQGVPLVIVHDPDLNKVQGSSQQLSAHFGALDMSAQAAHMLPVSPVELPAEVPAIPPATLPAELPAELPAHFDRARSPDVRASSISTSSNSQSLKRRPVPLSPAAPLRTVKAIHDFVAESTNELTFSAGDTMEILDAKSENGWWRAKLAGQTGLIPSTYVKNVDDEAVMPREKALEPSLLDDPSITMTLQPLTPPITPSRPATASPGSPAYDIDHAISDNRSVASASPSIISPRRMNSISTTISSSVDTEPVHRRQTSYIEGQYFRYAIEEPPGSGQVDPNGTETGSGDVGASSQIARQPTIFHTLHGHSKSVTTAVFNPAGDTIASGSKDSTIRLWDPAFGRFQQLLSGHTADVGDVRFAPDGRVLASASWDKTVRLWDARTRTSMHTLKNSTSVSSVAISPDSRIFAAALANDKIELWDSRSLSILKTLKGHKGMVRSVAFSPDGRLLISGSNDKTVRKWDPISGQEMQTIKASSGMMSHVVSVAFSPDGKLLASGSFDSTVKIWDSSFGSLVHTLKHERLVRDVSFSPIPGDNLVAVVSMDTLTLWNYHDGQEIHNLSKPHGNNNINSVAFSPDAQVLVTTSDDKTAKLWKLT